jgi:hypothetical protein
MKEALPAMKVCKTPRDIQQTKRESAIHKELKYGLIREIRGRYSGVFDPSTLLVTEVARNGSLVNSPLWAANRAKGL